MVQLVASDIFFGLCVILARGVQGPDDGKPIVTDRPDFTESSVVVPRGSLQLESGLTFEHQPGNSRSLSGPELLMRYGMTDRFELRLGLPSYNRLDVSSSPRLEGFGDTYLGAKLQIGPSRDGTDFAIIPAIFIPTGNRNFRGESISPEVKLVFSRGLENGYALSGMLYLASTEVAGRRDVSAQHTLSLGIPLRNNVGLFIEHAADFRRGSEASHLLHSGFTFQPKSNAQFDIHYGIGLSRSAPDFFVGAGYSIFF